MKQLWFILAAALIGSGCATHDTDSHEEQEAERDETVSGGLSLSLVSSDSQGRAYRLRNASFTVNPEFWWGGSDGGVSPSTVLSTEDNPDADRLSVRLAPGYYTVWLGGDWYIERNTPAGWERVEQVVLLGEPVQYAYIDSGWNYDLEFRFGVDGTLIDFRHGDLNIGIGIELPGEQPTYPSYDAGFPLPPLPTDGGVIYGDGGTVFFP